VYIRSLTLQNWGPYYGSHMIELRDTVYAVQAAHVDDPDRSNWIGKSWFLGAIRFLLTGAKPESCVSEDAWVSRGETSGGVMCVFSDGTLVSRTRKVGSSTQLELRVRGKGIAKQDQAQTELDGLIGMDHDDLMATCFVEQRQIARLVLADPAERTKIVNGWLELEPLQRAEDWLKVELSRQLTEDRELAARIVVFDPGAAEAALARTERAESALTAYRNERSDLADQTIEMADWRRSAEYAERFKLFRQHGLATRNELNALVPIPIEPLKLATEQASQVRATARDREYQLRELVGDQWDGVCPKTCEACPAQDHVRTIGASMQVELTEAESAIDDADSKYRQLDKELAEAHRVDSERAQKTRLLEHYRKEATQLLGSVDLIEEMGLPPDDAEMRARVTELDGLIAVAERELVVALVDLQLIEDGQKASSKATKARKALERGIRLHQEAIAIVGRQGAQREIAERVLGDIQDGANHLLQGAGIDLTVEVSWAREGKGLATHCEACGAGYPKTLSQKTCGICGAVRGPKLVEKLMIVPSDRSGAADDIAGLSFQLAASSWLRSKRAASWAVACIDEPFGQLDRANSRALSAHLHSMIRSSYAFEQGFLVAHDAAIMEALPSRVQIVGTERGSTLKVIG